MKLQIMEPLENGEHKQINKQKSKHVDRTIIQLTANGGTLAPDRGRGTPWRQHILENEQHWHNSGITACPVDTWVYNNVNPYTQIKRIESKSSMSLSRGGTEEKVVWVAETDEIDVLRVKAKQKEAQPKQSNGVNLQQVWNKAAENSK